MKQARTTLITKGLFHLFQCVRTCPSFLHGTEDKTQTAKSGLATSFLVRFVKLYRYWFSINMASSSADDTSFFTASTIVTLDLLWSSLALHITTTTQHSFFRASRAIATYQRITSNVILDIWSVASTRFLCCLLAPLIYMQSMTRTRHSKTYPSVGTLLTYPQKAPFAQVSTTRHTLLLCNSTYKYRFSYLLSYVSNTYKHVIIVCHRRSLSQTSCCEQTRTLPRRPRTLSRISGTRTTTCHTTLVQWPSISP